MNSAIDGAVTFILLACVTSCSSVLTTGSTSNILFSFSMNVLVCYTISIASSSSGGVLSASFVGGRDSASAS